MCNVKCGMMEKYKDYVFDFDKLDLYQMALDFTRKAFEIHKRVPQVYRFSIGGQFTRAALSIANNIAEGSGKPTKPNRIKFYSIALTSARECIPMITLLFSENQITKEEHKGLRSDCLFIRNKIGKLIKSQK